MHTLRIDTISRAPGYWEVLNLTNVQPVCERLTVAEAHPQPCIPLAAGTKSASRASSLAGGSVERFFAGYGLVISACLFCVCVCVCFLRLGRQRDKDLGLPDQDLRADPGGTQQQRLGRAVPQAAPDHRLRRRGRHHPPLVSSVPYDTCHTVQHGGVVQSRRYISC